jgi:hypothetical protein
MAKIGRRPTDDQLLEGGGGGGAGAGISGTKWSKMPSFKGNSDAVSDIKKLTKDTSHLKGGARDASDEAKGRAATRTAVRAAGVAAVNEGTKAALNNTASAKEGDEDSFKVMERSLREADADIESSKYGKGDKLKRGGMVGSSASSRADGCATKGKTRGKVL